MPIYLYKLYWVLIYCNDYMDIWNIYLTFISFSESHYLALNFGEILTLLHCSPIELEPWLAAPWPSPIFDLNPTNSNLFSITYICINNTYYIYAYCIYTNMIFIYVHIFLYVQYIITYNTYTHIVLIHISYIIHM